MELTLEIGKIYKNRQGRLVKITKGLPPIDVNGKLTKDGWNGIYFGDSVDKKKPKIYNERYKFNGKHWDYFSFCSGIITGESDNSFNIPENDLIEIYNKI